MTTVDKAIQTYRAGKPVAEPEDRAERTALRRLISADFKDLITAKAALTGQTRNAIATDAARRLVETGRDSSGNHWARNAFGSGRIPDEGETRALAAALGIPVADIDMHLLLAPWAVTGQAQGVPAASEDDGEGVGTADQNVSGDTQENAGADDRTTDTADPGADQTVPAAAPEAGDEFTICALKDGEFRNANGTRLSRILIREAVRPKDLKEMARALEKAAARLRKAAGDMKAARRHTRRADKLK